MLSGVLGFLGLNKPKQAEVSTIGNQTSNGNSNLAGIVRDSVLTTQIDVVASVEPLIITQTPEPAPMAVTPAVPTATYSTDWGSEAYLRSFGEGSYYALGFYSWYWPPLGGINCDTDANGQPECEYVANGDSFRDWIGRGVACPAEIPLGSRIFIRQVNQSFRCIDRGGAIVFDGNRFWIDVLTDTPGLNWHDPIDLIISPAG